MKRQIKRQKETEEETDKETKKLACHSQFIFVLLLAKRGDKQK